MLTTDLLLYFQITNSAKNNTEANPFNFVQTKVHTLDFVTFANQSKDSLQPWPEVAHIGSTVAFPDPPLDLLNCSEARSASPSSSQSSPGLEAPSKSDLLPSTRRWARASSFSSIISLISCLTSANLPRSLLSTTKTMALVFL